MNTERTKTRKFILRTLIMILGVLPCISFAGVEWTQTADMLTPRVSLSTIAVDGKIYAIGGRTDVRSGFSTTAAVEEYDPATNQWTTKASMLNPRYSLSTSVVGGKIYAMGGAGKPTGPNAIVEEYDPVTDTWIQKTSMPAEHFGHSSAAVDGKIYVIAGSDVEIYDPLTDTWARGADRPSPPRKGPVSVVDGKIYSMGGIGDAPNWATLSTVEAYDPATDTWTTKTNMPRPTDDFSSTVSNGKIYAIGGSSGSLTPLSRVEVYDPTTDTWAEAPPISIARMNPSVCAVEGIIYVMGGFQPNPGGSSPISIKTVEALDLTPMVDFNGDDAVDIFDLLRLTESWGLDDPLVDIGPMPWGDGVINASDVLVLAEYMVRYDSEASDTPTK